MTIAALKKISVLGPASEEAMALEGLQALGCMHLLPLAPEPERPEDASTRTAKDAYKALKFLTEVPDPRRQVRRDPDFDIAAFIAEVLELQQRIREARDKRDFLNARIAAVRPWGNLDFPPHDALAGQMLWFYQLPVKERAALDDVALPWEIVARDTRSLFVVIIAPEDPPEDILPVPRTHTGSLPIHELDAEVEETEIALEALEADRLACTRYLTLMRARMSEAESRAELDFAHQQVLTDEAMFALQGWVPEDRVDDVYALAQSQGFAVLIEEPAFDETPPTLLEQPEERAAGVDLAMFYQVPGYRDWDPTVILVASFSLFFAMIVADAGYGLIIAGIVGAYWSRLGGTAHARSWRRLLAILAAATLVYGVLVGSYLGFSPREGSLLAGLKIMSVDDFGTMMTLSIVIGVAHLVLGNVLAARARWGRTVAYASLGWCAVLIGGLILWLADSDAISTLGTLTMVGGFGGVLAFTSERPIKDPIDWLWRGLDGLQGLAGAMGLFGDVLSYMRLFALGLASASLAITFNDLAG
ncbi:MAG: V-type ATP synthase subunit I, partial [Pseudomonadota bacterium]